MFQQKWSQYPEAPVDTVLFLTIRMNFHNCSQHWSHSAVTTIPENPKETSHILWCQYNIIVSDLFDDKKVASHLSCGPAYIVSCPLYTCLLQLWAPQVIIIRLNYGRASKSGEHLKHAGRTVPCTVLGKVQSCSFCITWGTDPPFQAQKAINSMEQHEEPAGLTESGNQLHESIADGMKKLPAMLTYSRIRGSKLQFVS